MTDLVYLINLPSEQVATNWKKPIGLLWIDGDHRYEAVKGDFEAWSPFIIQGGIIAFHDSTDPELGPYHVVKEATSMGAFTLERQIDKVAVLIKR